MKISSKYIGTGTFLFGTFHKCPYNNLINFLLKKYSLKDLIEI